MKITEGAYCFSPLAATGPSTLTLVCTQHRGTRSTYHLGFEATVFALHPHAAIILLARYEILLSLVLLSLVPLSLV